MSKTPADPEPRLPVIIGRFGLYATYVAAALFLLVIAGDLDILLRNGPWVGWLALLVGTGPLLAVLLSTLASYTNYYGTWRILRRKDVYNAGQDLKSHAADVPQAVQDALAGRAGCLPLASTILLACSLLLAVAPTLPPGTPVVGALGTWGDHVSDLPFVSHAATQTATPSPTATLIEEPTATATAAATATLSPTATATTTPSPVVMKFSISPTSAFWNCTSQGTPAGAQTITLDNSGSTVAVTWSATAVERDAAGNPWAVFSPASGQIPAYGKQTMTITPDPRSSICVPSSQMSWHANIVANNAGTNTFTYTTSWIIG